MSIDIARWYGFIRIRINGYHSIAVEDGCAHDGVVQVLESVLIPPRTPKGAAFVEGEISVEELVERLGPYVEGNGEGEAVDGDIRTGDGVEKEQVWGEL